jgi:methionyl-tRNA formyltransferase
MDKENKYNIVIVTQDEPFYLPIYLDKAISKLGNNIEILKIYSLPANIHNKTFHQTIRYYLMFFGIRAFIFLVLLRCYYGMSDILRGLLQLKGNYHSIRMVCRDKGVNYSRVMDINDIDILEEMDELEPDFILSLACPQRFKEVILRLPREKCLNIHSAILPRYRGINANFWVMAKGEKETGVTIHEMTKEFDEGAIVLQEKFAIQDEWSLNDLYKEVTDVGSGMISKCFRLWSEGRIERIIQNKDDGSYFSLPQKDDVKEFRRRKKKYFRYF